MNSPNESFTVPSLRLSCCIARNARFIVLEKKWGNKCLIVIMEVHLRRRFLQFADPFFGIQTHLILDSGGWKNGGSPGKKKSSTELSIPVFFPFEDMLSLSSSLRALVTDFAVTDSASENHAHSEYLLVNYLEKSLTQVSFP